MKNPTAIPKLRRPPMQLFVMIFVLTLSWQAHAQPVIVSTVPANGASGVSPSAAVVFTFSEQMDTALTVAQFVNALTFTPLRLPKSRRFQ